MNEEEKEEMELNIEAKYVGRTEKEFLNIITYSECLYILNTKNNYCDDIKNLSLLKIVDIISKLQKELDSQKRGNKDLVKEGVKLSAKIVELQKELDKKDKVIKQLEEDISNMYDEKVVRNILEDECGLSKFEIDEILN